MEFSGGYLTKTEIETRVNGPGGHQIGLIVARGPQETNDSNFEGAMLTLWGTTLMLDGNGTMRGNFSNSHPNGDISYGSSEGIVTMVGDAALLKGSFRFTGGTGKFARLTGSGVFEEKDGPDGAIGVWNGSYLRTSYRALDRISREGEVACKPGLPCPPNPYEDHFEPHFPRFVADEMFLMIFPLIIIGHGLKQLIDEWRTYAWNHPL